MTQAPTVMFVDDEDDIRTQLAALVRMEGYRVFEARSTYGALNVLAQERVDVLFADFAMIEVEGIQLAERARQLQPHIRVRFTTVFNPARLKDVLGALGEVMHVVTRQLSPYQISHDEADSLQRLSLPGAF
jgi:CheY-like chemotaxis protein